MSAHHINSRAQRDAKEEVAFPQVADSRSKGRAKHEQTVLGQTRAEMAEGIDD